MSGTLRRTRIATLTISAILALATIVVGHGAVVDKSHNLKTLRKLAPAGIEIDGNLSDVTVTTAGSITTFVFSVTCLLLNVMPSAKKYGSKFCYQAVTLLLFNIVTIDAMIHFMVDFAKSEHDRAERRRAGTSHSATTTTGEPSTAERPVSSAFIVSGATRVCTSTDAPVVGLLGVIGWVSVTVTPIAVGVLFRAKAAPPVPQTTNLYNSDSDPESGKMAMKA